MLRWILFALLLATSAVALVGLPRAFERGWPSWARLLPVGLLLLFIVGYAFYRWSLVRAGRYSSGKALIRVGAMLLALGVIAGIALDRPPVDQAPSLDLAGPLASPDPAQRALAAELVRYRPHAGAIRHVPRLLVLLDDPAPDVRREAHAALVALAGEDVGEGPDASARWRQLWIGRGVSPAP